MPMHPAAIPTPRTAARSSSNTTLVLGSLPCHTEKQYTDIHNTCTVCVKRLIYFPQLHCICNLISMTCTLSKLIACDLLVKCTNSTLQLPLGNLHFRCTRCVTWSPQQFHAWVCFIWEKYNLEVDRSPPAMEHGLSEWETSHTVVCTTVRIKGRQTDGWRKTNRWKVTQFSKASHTLAQLGVIKTVCWRKFCKPSTYKQITRNLSFVFN